MIFGNANGQGLSHSQSNYNPLAQYLTSPPGSGSEQQLSTSAGDAEVEKKKWMLATGLGGMFTPGKTLLLYRGTQILSFQAQAER
jgi:hypothetical protein